MSAQVHLRPALRRPCHALAWTTIAGLAAPALAAPTVLLTSLNMIFERPIGPGLHEPSGLFHVAFDVGSDGFRVEAPDLQFSTSFSTGQRWEQLVFGHIENNPPATGGVPGPASLPLVLGALGLTARFSRRR